VGQVSNLPADFQSAQDECGLQTLLAAEFHRAGPGAFSITVDNNRIRDRSMPADPAKTFHCYGSCYFKSTSSYSPNIGRVNSVKSPLCDNARSVPALIAFADWKEPLICTFILAIGIDFK
jgi:hypothetical protein